MNVPSGNWLNSSVLLNADHDYTQAIMDLVQPFVLPKNPLCLYCPMQQHCKAHQQGLENELPFKKAKKPVPVTQLRSC